MTRRERRTITRERPAFLAAARLLAEPKNSELSNTLRLLFMERGQGRGGGRGDGS